MTISTRLGACVAAALIALSPVCAARQADAQTTATATISGTVVDAQNGLPISDASVTLYQGDRSVASAQAGANGTFTISGVAPGVYQALISASGYRSSRTNDLVVAPGTSSVNVATAALVRAQSAGAQSAVIGRTSSEGRSTVLQSTATINRTIDTQRLLNENYYRIGDALAQIPGVNLRGQSTTLGDDLYVDIRGLKPSESQTLLDGHPIGPIGVFPGTGGGFNYQASPLFAIANTQVTFGSGGTGLYGVASTGGTIDMQTISPTQTSQFSYRQSAGDFGLLTSAATATGSFGNLGYALVWGTQGTYAQFAPGLRQQTGFVSFTSAGLPDFTSATQSQLNYQTSGDYLLRNALVKLNYQFAPNINFTLTGLGAYSYDDKTGVGDNDFNTPAYQAANAPVGNDPSCPAGVLVQYDSGTQCLPVSQYASLTAGPAGGGPGAFQNINMQDYHARFNAQFGAHNIVADTFINNYFTIYNRDASFIQGALQTNTTRYRTYGTLISDDIQLSPNNTFALGAYLEQQKVFGDDNTANTGGVFVQRPTLFERLNSYFIRDIAQITPQFTLFANAWLEHSSVTNQTTFDPRLSLVFRPTANDVIRLTGGKSNGQPAISVISGPTTFSSAGSINAGNCSTFSIGSAPNPALTSEGATDIEVALGHRFANRSQIEVDLYQTNVTNQIFSGQAPLSLLGSNIPPNLNDYFNRIRGLCPSLNPTINNLTFSTAFNTATARAKGIETNARVYVARNVFVDASYDIQSTVQNDVPDAILRRNQYIVNGFQTQSIPLHKATLGVEALDPVSSTDIRIDGFFVGENNSLSRGGYTYWNGSLTTALGTRKNVAINFGIQNIFNNVSGLYGLIGSGYYYPQNQFFSNPNALAQGSEQFSLLPRNASLSLILKI